MFQCRKMTTAFQLTFCWLVGGNINYKYIFTESHIFNLIILDSVRSCWFHNNYVCKAILQNMLYL